MAVLVLRVTPLVLAFAGCDTPSDGSAKTKPASGLAYGEPIGIRLEASPPVPALAVSVAISQGRDPGPSVGSLAAALRAAAAACPTLLHAVSAAETVRLELGARDGAFEPWTATTDTAASCMSGALAGKPLRMDRPDRLDLVVDIKLGAAPVAADAAIPVRK